MTTDEKNGGGAARGVTEFAEERTIRCSSRASIVEGQNPKRFLRRLMVYSPVVVSLSMSGRRTLGGKAPTRSLFV